MPAVEISSKPSAYTAKPYMIYRRSSKTTFLNSLMNKPEIDFKKGRENEYFLILWNLILKHIILRI